MGKRNPSSIRIDGLKMTKYIIVVNNEIRCEGGVEGTLTAEADIRDLLSRQGLFEVESVEKVEE